MLPFFPLANGLLTGKVRQGQAIPTGSRLAARQGYVTEEKLAKVEALVAWAQEHGVTLLETAIGALAAQPGCSSVIAGATSAEQVKANAAAAEWTPPPPNWPRSTPSSPRQQCPSRRKRSCRRPCALDSVRPRFSAP